MTFVDGTEFKTIRLATQDGIKYPSRMQVASIVIEAVLLFLKIANIEIEVSNEIIDLCSQNIVAELDASSAFDEAVTKFVIDWNGTENVLHRAKALFYLLKDTYTLGILWTIIKTLYIGIDWWDWIKAVAIISAMIIAAHATGGLALFAKIALALKSAYDFSHKIENLEQLQSLKPTKMRKVCM